MFAVCPAASTNFNLKEIFERYGLPLLTTVDFLIGSSLVQALLDEENNLDIIFSY